MSTWTSPKTYTAGSALTAAEMNTYQRDNLLYLYDRISAANQAMQSDVSKTGATFTDITGLTFPVVNGTNYSIFAMGTYTVGGVNTGLTISANHPGGDIRGIVELASATAGSFDVAYGIAAADGGTGSATTGGTTPRTWRANFRYQCTSSGTFALRYARAGTSTTVTIEKGSGMYVVS